MTKPWVRCSREIRLLTDELSQMRRELRTLQWSLVGVILLMSFLCLWMSRMRRSLNYGTTTSTNGTPVETISVQSSPPASLVIPPRSEDFVRVSNDASSPPAQIARYRRNMSVTPTVPQETLVSCFHRSHQLLPGSKRCLCVPHLFGLPAPRKVDSFPESDGRMKRSTHRRRLSPSRRHKRPPLASRQGC